MKPLRDIKRQTERLLRHVGLEPLIYHYVGWKDRRRFAARDRAFLAANPDLALPPPRLRFDVVACSSAEYYVQSGRKMAGQIHAVMRQWVLPATATVCEWGCGPGRVLFPLASHDTSGTMTFVGTDAYAPSIAWAQSVPGGRIRFLLNRMEPPLAIPDASVDFAYAISVFTHLSDHLSRQWFQEIMRILRPGGVFWFSTHSGRNHRHELTAQQLVRLDRGEFVAISSWHNGSQMYTGIHSPTLVKNIIASCGADLLDYQAGGNNTFQDAWIVRKRSGSTGNPSWRGVAATTDLC